MFQCILTKIKQHRKNAPPAFFFCPKETRECNILLPQRLGDLAPDFKERVHCDAQTCRATLVQFSKQKPPHGASWISTSHERQELTLLVWAGQAGRESQMRPPSFLSGWLSRAQDPVLLYPHPLSFLPLPSLCFEPTSSVER